MSSKGPSDEQRQDKDSKASAHFAPADGMAHTSSIFLKGNKGFNNGESSPNLMKAAPSNQRFFQDLGGLDHNYDLNLIGNVGLRSSIPLSTHNSVMRTRSQVRKAIERQEDSDGEEMKQHIDLQAPALKQEISFKDSEVI